MNTFLRESCSGAKNFFPLPNAIFTLGLSAGELAVYAYLMFCEDRKSHQCWPSYKTIGRAVGMSENTVRKYVRELEYKTLILTEPTKYESASGQVRNGNLIFTILPIYPSREQSSTTTSASCGNDPFVAPVRAVSGDLGPFSRDKDESRPRTPFWGICGDLWEQCQLGTETAPNMQRVASLSGRTGRRKRSKRQAG
ncbi:helix-turn-helix domain-containing protein [Acutalibacter muris]|jgi:hypothetical protein|uniref:helix-turn-helix domain-containing protein n=1 Tax=Acutalibacter muris TaxID=1796620 RepID=UPI002ED62E17